MVGCGVGKYRKTKRINVRPCRRLDELDSCIQLTFFLNAIQAMGVRWCRGKDEEILKAQEDRKYDAARSPIERPGERSMVVGVTVLEKRLEILKLEIYNHIDC